jgi:hypothetical protein
VQPDGRLVVVGTTGTGLNHSETRGFAVARYLGGPRGADGDSDDQLAESRRISAGAAPLGNSLAGATDVDVYEVVIPEAGRRIGFDVDGPTSGATDALLRLFTSEGAELAMNDSGAAPGETSGVSPYLEFTFSAPGTYSVGVSTSANRAYNPLSGGGDAGGGGAGGSYTLSLTDRTPAAQDVDDQLKEARPIAIDTTADGRIDRATDVDVLSFTAAIGQRVSFDVVALSGALRPHLRLLADDGTELAVGDAGATVNASSLDFTFSAAGTYYVAVSSRPNVAFNALTGDNDAGATGATGATGTYRLRTRDLTPGGQFLQAEDAAFGGAAVRSDNVGYTGAGYVDFVNTEGDYVEWSLTVPTAGVYTLQFRYANGGSKGRPLELRVNGQAVVPAVPFLPTGGWTAWGNTFAAVRLTAGVNTIRLTAAGASGPNVDVLNVVPATR